jgi:hypothetical protein
MESTGLFVVFFGAAALFFADWQNLSAEWVASILFAVAAMGGFFVNRWRVRLSIFLTATLLAAEWASEHLRFWESHVHAAFPNILILAGLSFIFALTASLMGAGVRSFFDAGRK